LLVEETPLASRRRECEEKYSKVVHIAHEQNPPKEARMYRKEGETHLLVIIGYLLLALGWRAACTYLFFCVVFLSLEIGVFT
jgi:hypothetical protein